MGSSTGILAIVGLGAAALFLTGSSKSARASTGAPATPNPAAPVTLPLGNPPEYDANLPAILQATVDQELANDTDPTALLSFAQSLANYYPIAAAALRARAAALQTPNPPPPPVVPNTPPPPPVTPTAPVIVSPTAPIVLPPPPLAPSPTGGPNGTPAGGLIAPLAPYQTNLAVDVSGVQIPGNYQGTSQQTKDVQGALNNWASQVGWAPESIPLTIDGDYGPSQSPPAGANSNTQLVAAGFQDWTNSTQNPTTPLDVDGLAGPLTRAWLAIFLPNASAGQVFSTDGGY